REDAAASRHPKRDAQRMAVQTILVVEDERQIAQIARDYLERAGYSVLTAPDGVSALQLARDKHPDLLVLDLGLPRMDGMEAARRLRLDSDLPIIMLTARVDEIDRLRGLDAGADDYITKPFSPRELVARVRTVLRRSGSGSAGADHFKAGDLTIDVPKMRIEQ